MYPGVWLNSNDATVYKQFYEAAGIEPPFKQNAINRSCGMPRFAASPHNSNVAPHNNRKFMKNIRSILGLILCALVSGCVITNLSTYQTVGNGKICNGKKLGKVAVLPEAAWRSDQKEPKTRERMAMDEIEKSFLAFPCGSISSTQGIREFSNWSSKPESELLAQFLAEGIDTIIMVRVEELTPRIQITFSLPFLWGGSSEADFRLRVLSTSTGAVLNDMRVKRLNGGPFNVRPAEWSRAELNSALTEVIGN